MKTFQTSHTVKYEDLNHHQSFYAGRAIELMLEASFMGVAVARGIAGGMVYKNTHKFDFMKPIRVGTFINYDVTVVRVGTKTITVRTGIYEALTRELLAEGYVTLCTVDEFGRACPCGLTLDEPSSEEEKAWRAEAESYFKK